MAKKLQFKVSSALKDILGRDLITDDYIAVFELVKNSFDAHSTEVKIIFNADSLVMMDNGKGMNYDDLLKKWLFVAYSAKHEGVEDDELLEPNFKDYRDKIQEKRIYAGSKGIGRFSCDRLGSQLRLTSRKVGSDAKIERLIIDWENFEKDATEEFVEIDVFHENPKEINNPDFQHGTILEITGLRSSWSRQKKKGLKHSLEKLINPFSSLEDTSIKQQFSIIINAEDEKDTDLKEKNRERINGPIENVLFEILNIKTTQILMEVSPKDDLITTTLNDRSIPIYELKEKNETVPKLRNIKYQLFYLNRSAKYNFSKRMGINSVVYGSIFLYKNGIRVYPFGEEGKDLLGIDRRKQQGTKRYLGTRELIGHIEITDDKDIFKETSSRDGGLIERNIMKSLKIFSLYA